LTLVFTPQLLSLVFPSLITCVVFFCVRPFQKRVVNVYRLITRGTLEEKIMGLQKFKIGIANTIISQENTSLQSMGTDQLLNLFTLDKVGRSVSQSVSQSVRAGGVFILECLGS